MLQHFKQFLTLVFPVGGIKCCSTAQMLHMQLQSLPWCRWCSLPPSPSAHFNDAPNQSLNDIHSGPINNTIHYYCPPFLIETLRSVHLAWVCWPQGDEFQELSQLVSNRYPLLSRVFGSIDGLNLQCQVLVDLEIENATYNSWLHGHYISSVIVFSSQGMFSGLFCQRYTLTAYIPGEIICTRSNCPGSWHDSQITTRIYKKLVLETPEGFSIATDSMFPWDGWRMEGKILVLLQHSDPLLLDGPGHCFVLACSCALLSYHQTAEWGIQQLQGSFRHLSHPFNINNND